MRPAEGKTTINMGDPSRLKGPEACTFLEECRRGEKELRKNHASLVKPGCRVRDSGDNTENACGKRGKAVRSKRHKSSRELQELEHMLHLLVKFLTKKQRMGKYICRGAKRLKFPQVYRSYDSSSLLRTWAGGKTAAQGEF